MASPIEAKLTRYYSGNTLNGTAITLKHDYNPKPGDGESDITENIPIVITGVQATVQSTINSINQYLLDARSRAKNQFGDRVYIEARASASATWRRSEIIDGRLSVTDGGIRAGLTSGLRTPATLTITRRGWFEETELQNVLFYNANGTTTQEEGNNPINLYNCSSEAGTVPSKLENYAVVDAANIVGDLPTPILINIGNPPGETAVDKYLISLVASHYGTVSPVYYFKDQSGTADATCSGGAATSYTLSTSSETNMFTIAITGADTFSQLGGESFHILARFRNNTSLANVKFRLKFLSGSTTVWSGPQILLSDTDIIQDLGVMNIPPGDSGSWGAGNLVITGQRTTAVSETIGLDFVQFFGGDYAELRGLVDLTADGYLSYGGADRGLIHIQGGGAPTRDWIAYGADALRVYPGRDNMLLILSQTSTPGTAEIDHATTIEAFYRPRWSTPL